MTANAGYHLFNTGDVLTASQVQYNLQNQTIMYFASSAARTSALSGVVVEGMFSYLADTNSTEYYDGAAWQSISNPGDITGVTAGTGISGGGTSGTVTVSIDTTVTVDKTTAQTLTNKTLTSPIISSISNTGTLTLPTSTDTLVGRATTDTLTNKTIDTASNTITGAVTLTGTQTLTNKTLTSPALTTPTISTLTTNGDLLYGTGSGALARLGIGTTGQVVTVASGLPSWATPAAGGGMTLINSGGTALTTATTTVSSIPGTYKYLIVYVTDYYMSTNDQLMRIYFNSDTTATNYSGLALRAASGAGDLGWNNDSRISQYGIKNASNENFASITVPDYANATTYKQILVNGSYVRGNDNIRANDLTIGSWYNTSAITSVSINTAGGTWSAGTMWVYGVN